MFICSQTKMWSSAHKQKCGHLLTVKVWSSSHRKRCGHLLTDKNVVVFSQTKVWSSAHRKNCFYLPHHPVSVLDLDFGIYRFRKVHCTTKPFQNPFMACLKKRSKKAKVTHIQCVIWKLTQTKQACPSLRLRRPTSCPSRYFKPWVALVRALRIPCVTYAVSKSIYESRSPWHFL